MLGMNGSSYTTHQPNSLFQRFNWADGSLIYRTSVWPLTPPDQIQSPTEKKERQEFDIAIENKFGDDPDY
jgi:hypothetical protein